jgi:hypothetical protein
MARTPDEIYAEIERTVRPAEPWSSYKETSNTDKIAHFEAVVAVSNRRADLWRELGDVLLHNREPRPPYAFEAVLRAEQCERLTAYDYEDRMDRIKERIERESRSQV